MPKIDSEQIRQSDPASHRKDRSRQSSEKTLLHVRREKIKRFYGKDPEPHRDGPVDVGPEQNEQIRQVDSAREPFPESWPDDHDRSRNQPEPHGQERQPNRPRAQL